MWTAECREGENINTEGQEDSVLLIFLLMSDFILRFFAFTFALTPLCLILYTVAVSDKKGTCQADKIEETQNEISKVGAQTFSSS